MQTDRQNATMQHLEASQQMRLPVRIHDERTGIELKKKADNLNTLRTLLARHAGFAFRLGLVWGTSGNMSARTDVENFLITATGKSLGEITARDLVNCSTTGNSAGRRASMEWRLHREIYRSRRDARAVFHAQPPYSTLIACAKDKKVRTSLIPETVAYLQRIEVVPYCHAGSIELAERCAEAAARADVLLLENHGAVTVGSGIEDAVNKTLALEFLCRLEIWSKSAGIELKEIPPRQADAFLKLLARKKGV